MTKETKVGGVAGDSPVVLDKLRCAKIDGVKQLAMTIMSMYEPANSIALFEISLPR